MNQWTQPAASRQTRLIVTLLSGLLIAACAAPPTPAPTPAALPATTAPAADSAPATNAPPATPAPAVTRPTATATPSEPAALTAPPIDCTPGTALTPAQTEGPYYKADTPERTSLIEPGMAGTRLILTGYVLNADCQPMANAWLDFWQADDAGAYDNAGYVMRGHQFTDAAGRYRLETVFPGLYPGRTRHIHVKVQAPNGPVLTTQLYFPDEAANARDGIFNPALIADVQATADGLRGTFNFVISTK
jgi:protocatechuate 3,4-dioxygenase beta subunit